MKLRDMIELLTDCDFMVLDLDSGLRTDYIPSYEKSDNPQLRTVLDKVVKQIYPDNESEEQGRIILEVASA